MVSNRDGSGATLRRIQGGLGAAVGLIRGGFEAAVRPIIGHTYRVAIVIVLWSFWLVGFGLVLDAMGYHVYAGISGALAVAFAIQALLAALVIWTFHNFDIGD